MSRGSESEAGIATTTGVAVAIVAIARFLATEHSHFPAYLSSAFEGAKASGLGSADLALLQTICQSIGG